MELIDRRPERRVLDEVLRDLRSGRSQALVVHGEAGVGKSALIEYLAGRASGCHLARAPGVQSEMELAFAGLHQLCAPMLDRLDRLPGPQRDALQTAFGLTGGPAPDQFLIGLAVLSLLSEVAEERPLLCLIDDQQWIDRASAQALAFVARRLQAESVAMVFGVRQPGEELAGLAELVVSGLPVADARELLASALRGPLDSRVRDQIVAETRGNPLALLEIPRGLTPAELAGGYGFPDMAPIPADMEDTFGKRIRALPEPTRRLLVLAAADATGDPGLVWRAAALLGIPADAAAAATQAGLAEFGTRIRFRHPLVRSATYQSATPAEQQHAHGALAQVINPATDAERRAWHRAHAVTGPDDDVAEELEHSAGQAQARGGLAAAAAFLERATMLTLDPTQRATRALSAATAKIEAGAFETALDLLSTAEETPLSDLQKARADLVRAQLAYVTGRGSDAPPLLLKAAQRLEPVDAELSRATYLQALSASIFAGRLATGGGAVDVARAVQALPRGSTERLPDVLLDGLARYFIDGNAAALPTLRRAIGIGCRDSLTGELLRCLWQVGVAALHVWDDDSWETLSTRHIELARAAGDVTEMPLALNSRAVMHLFAGELKEAETLVHEVQAVTEATGSSLSPYGAISLAAFRGDQSTVSELTEATMTDARIRGEGIGLTVAEWANAVLYNGCGRYVDAMAAARRAAEEPVFGAVSNWAAVELVEAVVRSGARESADEAFSQLREATSASGTDWALGIEARTRALLSRGAEADRRYRDAIELLGRTRMRADLARSHLLYGEWLRREHRRIDARSHLRVAHGELEAMGMAAFAERARRELVATGETARKRAVAAVSPELTRQEAQIARLAAEGLTNSEIGMRLFISVKTVQYHLTKVFTKLGIGSRSQLRQALSSGIGV